MKLLRLIAAGAQMSATGWFRLMEMSTRMRPVPRARAPAWINTIILVMASRVVALRGVEPHYADVKLWFESCQPAVYAWSLPAQCASR